jgi:hypothetical protein
MLTYRQGDVLIVPIERLPQASKHQDLPGKIVLAYGETTGHHHCIETTDRVEAYRQAEGLYLQVFDEVEVIHEEHCAVALQPGTYKLIYQHDFRRKELRRVVD